MATAQAPGAIDTALGDLEARYAAANPISHRLHEQRCETMPGGNTRTLLYHDPFPLTIERGDGCRVTDVDGHVYVDLLGEYTAGLYGHTEAHIAAALHEAIDCGVVLGGPNRAEGRLARGIVSRFPAIEQVRFTNSGTEATLLALTLARHCSGRGGILVFDGGYHGSTFLFGGGGSPVNAPFPFVLAPYNDLETAVALIREHAGQLAAVLVEGVQGSAGVICGEPAFLHGLGAACRDHGVLFVLDEVMTSRLGPGGLHGELGLEPDLVILGKYLGGGLSFGAFGGRRELMAAFDVRRPGALPHAGTFNQDALTMAAGAAGLERVLTPAALAELNDRGDRLRTRITVAAHASGRAFTATGRGSLLGLHPVDGPIRASTDLARGDADELARRRTLLHLDLLEAGFSIARRGFCALSLAVGDAEADAFALAIERFLDGRAALLEPTASR